MKSLNTVSEKQLHLAPYTINSISSIFLNMFAAQAVLYAYKKDLFAFLAPTRQQHSLPQLKDVAHYMNISLRAAQAILSICCALNLICIQRQKGEEGFKLTSLAEAYLLPESPFWYGGVLEDLIENNFMTSLETLEKACETNTPQITVGEHFKTANHTPQIAANFLKLMHAKSTAPASIWPAIVDLKNIHTILDIGGGTGTHTVHACLHWPHLKGIIFDLAFACRGASKFSARLGLDHRIRATTGDMWQDAFPAADLHFYSDILHDWSVNKGRFLLEKSFAALPSRGRILIHERLFNADKTGPITTSAYNLMMLLWTEGQQLSQQELEHMLTEIGFINITTHQTIDDWSITLGHKA